MEETDSYPSVRKCFPEWSKQISQLAQQDPDFDEACSDYEELKSWLAAHDHEECPAQSACTMNRLLLAELEVEILQYLQATGRHPYR